jgi:hypothetical protein
MLLNPARNLIPARLSIQSPQKAGSRIMSLCIEIYHEPDGQWLFEGVPGYPPRLFADLAAGLEWAERAVSSAPAQIELYIDGVYAVVHQEKGWPRKLCRPDVTKTFTAPRTQSRPYPVPPADTPRRGGGRPSIWDALHRWLEARHLDPSGTATFTRRRRGEVSLVLCHSGERTEASPVSRTGSRGAA